MKKPGKGAPRRGGKPAGKPAGRSAAGDGAKSTQRPRPKPQSRPASRQQPRDSEPTVNMSPAGTDVVRVSRIVDAPPAAILRAIIDADRRGWAPTPLYRVVSVLAPRFVRLALPDGSDVAIGVVRQGNTRCAVQVEHSKLPATRTQSEVRNEWMGCLAGLAEQLDAEWD